MITEKCEQKIKEIVKDYGAPDNITGEIIDFLFDSGNIYTIVQEIEADIKNAPYESMLKECKSLLKHRKLIHAVKEYKKFTRYNLKESIKFVKSLDEYDPSDYI